MSQTLYFYCILALVFVIDVSLFFLLEQQVLHLLLCFIIIQLFQAFSPLRILILSCLLCLESFLFYNSFTLPLFYLLPAVLASSAAKRLLYTSWLYPLALLGMCLTIQAMISVYYLGNSPPFFYTIAKISANITMIWLFSLTLKAYGGRGNRS